MLVKYATYERYQINDDFDMSRIIKSLDEQNILQTNSS